MKRLLKTVILLLCGFITVACGEAKESEVFEKNAVEYRDFDGNKVIFLTSWVHNYVSEADSPSLAFEREDARLKEVENNNNFKFDFYGDKINITSTIIQMVATSEPVHVVDQDALVINGLYKAGLLIPYEDITTMDITDESKFGSYNLRRHGIYDGLSYGFTTFKNWGWTPEIDGVLMFDNTKIKEFNLTSPYELYEQGKWKWDVFKEMLDAFSFQGNADNPSRFGLNIGSVPLVMKMAIHSNGGHILAEKEGGGLAFSLNSPEATEAMEWIASLNTAKHIKADDRNIGNGNYLFGAFESWIPIAQVVSLTWLPAYTMEDYGVLNFPYGPKGVYGSSSAMISGSRRLISLINGDMGVFEPDDIGFIFDQLAEPIYNGDTQVTWKDYARGVFHHEKGLECFEEMCNKVSYDFSVQLKPVSSKIESAFTSIFKGSSTAKEAVDKIEQAVTEEISKKE